MKNPLNSFGVRVTSAIVASMVVLILLANSVIYQVTVKSQFEDLRVYLKGIAKTSAAMIDPELLLQIPLNHNGITSPAYEMLSNQLKKIKAVNPQIKYIYILMKTENDKAWKFAVDIDQTTPGAMTPGGAVPGAIYDASRFSEMLRALNQPSVDLRLEKDEWGTTLSGYAPIRDSLGRPLGVLGVDVDATHVYKMKEKIRKKVLFLLLMGLTFAIGLGFIISHRVMGPVNELKSGIEYIREGHWHHQVRVVGDDEIAQLGRAFNEMASGLHDSREKLVNYFYDAVKALVMLLEARDHYTLGHSEAVARYSEMIALRLGMDVKKVEYFKRVVLLHDIGKVGIRDNILLKPGKLDDHEWNIIKLHPVLGEQILKPILNDPLMLSVVRNHHERYDGRGYPDGWSKDQIPLLVAIVTVADSFDAMLSTRSYRQAMTKQQGMDELIKNRGTQFHPDVVDIFLTILREQDEETPT